MQWLPRSGKFVNKANEAIRDPRSLTCDVMTHIFIITHDGIFVSKIGVKHFCDYESGQT